MAFTSKIKALLIYSFSSEILREFRYHIDRLTMACCVDNSKQQLLIALNDWTKLTNIYHQYKIFGSGALFSEDTTLASVSRIESPQNAKTPKQFRETCTFHAARVAKHLIDTLVKNDNPNTFGASNDVATLINAEDIATKNFIVEIQLPQGHNISMAPSVPELIKKCGVEQIESIVNGPLQVTLIPSLQNKRGFQIDETIGCRFYCKLGLLFYELFTGGESPPPQFHTEVVSERTNEIKVDDAEWDKNNEEERGAKKKGRMCFNPSEKCEVSEGLDLTGRINILHQMSLPTSICRLVTDLMEADKSDESAFESLNDVLLELEQIINSPDIFLRDKMNNEISLDFENGVLYGRCHQLSALIEATLMAPSLSESSITSVVLIQGEPGIGKSKFVTSIFQPLADRGWKTVRCKFDRSKQNQPLSTISYVFNDFFQHFADMMTEVENGFRLSVEEEQYIREKMSLVESLLCAPGIVALSKLIPSFRSLFPDIFIRVVADEDEDASDDESDRDNTSRNDIGPISGTEEDEDCFISDTIKSQSHYLFQKLTYAMSNPEEPLLLFLDDLHWADDESLELLSSLISQNVIDENIGQRCMCFVATYRNNEVSNNRNLADFISAIEGANSVQATNISLGGMGKHATNSMISNALKLPIRLTRPLSNIVQNKTLGNPFFVKEFLKVLVEDNCLSYSLSHKRWMWNTSDVHQRSMDRDLAFLLSQRLLRLPQGVQDALTFMSCFGRSVHADVLGMIIETERDQLFPDRFLELALEVGILEKSDETYAFPHDLIQQVAYERVSKEKSMSIHFHIGMQIVQKSVFTGIVDPTSPLSFIAIEQIIMSRNTNITDPDLKQALAALFLKVGRHSIRIAAFPSALVYFEQGISFLSGNGWKLNHELCLRLHESACHACYLNALPDKVSELAGIVVSHCSDFMEQIRCHLIVMQTLASSGKIKEAVNKFFEVAKELKEEFPVDVTSTTILRSLLDTKDALDSYSTEKLLSIRSMSDKGKKWAMIFMETILPYIFMVSPQHTPLIATRMVSLSLKYGLVRESAFGLNSYSYSLLCLLQDIEGGCRWSIAKRMILERFDATELYPRLKLLQYSFFNFWMEPFQSVANVISQCRQESMMVGDIEYAIFSAHVHCQCMIPMGTPLADVEKACDSLTSEMSRLKQVQSFPDHASIHGIVLQLIGSDKSQFDYSGIPFKNEIEMLQDSLSSGKIVYSNAIFMNRTICAFFFRRYRYAAEMAEKISKGNETIRFQTVFYAFYEGLVAFQMIRSGDDQQKWLRISEQSIASYQKWVKHSKWNFENKLLLLEAESLFTKGEHDLAEEKYLASIDSARQHRFVHEEGLAMDLISSFYKFRGEVENEKKYLESSYACYKKWGACGLLKQLQAS